MKAVLIIDIPNTCTHCPCCDGEYFECMVLDDYPRCDSKQRLSKCPLKPLEEYKREVENDLWKKLILNIKKEYLGEEVTPISLQEGVNDESSINN